MPLTRAIRSLCVALAMILPQGIPAAGQGVQSPILTVDQDRIVQETKFGQEIEARYKRDSEALLAENLRLEAALEEEERKLTEQRATLAADEFHTLATAFDTKAEQIRAAQTAKSAAILDQRDADRQRFLDKVLPILDRIMADHGGVVIMNAGSLIRSAASIDITDEAISRIDSEVGDGSQTPAP